MNNPPDRSGDESRNPMRDMHDDDLFRMMDTVGETLLRVHNMSDEERRTPISKKGLPPIASVPQHAFAFEQYAKELQRRGSMTDKMERVEGNCPHCNYGKQ